MNAWVLFGASVVGVLTSIALFFFVFTRGALLLRSAAGEADGAAHVYPIYSDMRLIKLIDWQPIISAILLFHYHRLVSKVVAELDSMDLAGRRVLITSCAFGNVIPRVVRASLADGAERVLIADIIPNELSHAEGKLGDDAAQVDLLTEDATRLTLADGTVAANVLFFLLHELPHHKKWECIEEAGRVLEPGGKLLIAEFHKPEPWLLKALGWTYFKVFEPFGLALWDRADPLAYLERRGGWDCSRETCCWGNFQVVTAVKR